MVEEEALAVATLHWIDKKSEVALPPFWFEEFVPWLSRSSQLRRSSASRVLHVSRGCGLLHRSDIPTSGHSFQVLPQA